jgi:hypothetical protein
MERNAKLFLEQMPDELKNEISTLYKMGVTSSEVRYLLSLRNSLD